MQTPHIDPARHACDRILTFAALSLSLMWPALAGDGRIPIWEPTVITASGNYVVTRDITASGIIIDIQPPASVVDIDLNGFTLQRTDSGIVVRAQADTSVPDNLLTISNGTILAPESLLDVVPITVSQTDSWAFQGVSKTTNGHIDLDNPLWVFLENVQARSIRINGSISQPVTGSISNVRLTNGDGAGLELVNGTAFSVRNVSIENPAGDGLRTQGCDGCQFDNVMVQDAGGAGVNVLDGTGNQFRNVTVFRAVTGFLVDALSQGNFLKNVTASFSQMGTRGLDNQGNQTHVSECTFHGNSGGGIRNTGSEFNIRMTISRGNAPPNFDDMGFNTWNDGSNCID